jgi:hypothetical protein
LEVGAVVVVLQQNDDGWWLGESHNRKGLFPSNMVKGADPLDEERASRPLAFVLQQYEPQAPDEVGLASYSLVSVLYKFPNGWWMVESPRDSGHFGAAPSTHLMELPRTPKLKALCLHQFVPTDPHTELSFEAQQMVDVLLQFENGWSVGHLVDKPCIGLFPSSFATPVSS